MPRGADVHPVDRAAVQLGVGRVRRVVEAGIEGHDRERPEAGAASLRVQCPRDGQHPVADGLAFEPPGGEPPEEAIVGVDLRRLGVEVGRLAIRR